SRRYLTSDGAAEWMESSFRIVMILKTVSHVRRRSRMDGVKFQDRHDSQDGISRQAAKPQ
ncbi:MAG TPA: hypothetical protein VJ751_01245, partial [Pyrinomonadaceae bacterium]|nr:hypothetical protein [Pyrinomonadaceae bacterium]